jgi:hypothetical protein
MVQVSQFTEMVLNYHQSSIFQSSQSYDPSEIKVMIKWLEIFHEGEMVLQNMILEIDPK